MQDIKKLSMTVPTNLAVDLDVLVSRYNMQRKDIAIALMILAIKDLKDSNDANYHFSTQQTLSLNAKDIDTPNIALTDMEKEKYESLLSQNTSNKFTADEETINYLVGLGDD